MTEARWKRLALGAFCGHLVLGLYMVERVSLNADEGWYLYAAQRVSEGMQLFQDLHFFQAPVMPHVYGGLLEPGPGMLLGARWISLMFLVLATGLVGLTVLRRGGRRAAVLALVFVGLHPMVVGAGVWAKPYALAMLLLAGGMFLWSGADRPARVLAGAVLLGLAAGVRLSLLPVPLVAIWAARRRGWAALGALVGLALAFRSVAGVSGTVLFDQLVGVHLPSGGDPLALIQDRMALLLRLSVAFAGFVVIAAISRCGRGEDRGAVERLAIGSIGWILIVQLLPGALHVEHGVVLVPFLGVLAGRGLAQIPQKPWAWATVVLGLVLGCISSVPLVQLDRGDSTLEQAADLGSMLRAEVPSNRTILTLQTALAVEAGRRVPPGFEMGRFGWTLGGLDRDGVLQAAAGPVGAVALAKGDLAEDPALHLVLQAAAQRMGRTRTIERFGQFAEPLLLGLPPAPTEVMPEVRE